MLPRALFRGCIEVCCTVLCPWGMDMPPFLLLEESWPPSPSQSFDHRIYSATESIYLSPKDRLVLTHPNFAVYPLQRSLSSFELETSPLFFLQSLPVFCCVSCEDLPVAVLHFLRLWGRNTATLVHSDQMGHQVQYYFASCSVVLVYHILQSVLISSMAMLSSLFKGTIVNPVKP